MRFMYNITFFFLAKAMPNLYKIKLLNNSSDWIEEVSGSELKGEQKIEETARNFYSSYTHSGLIWYFYLCWLNGYIACLRPDMIWTTILNEISIIIQSNESSWKDMFNFEQNNKEMVTTMNYNSAIDINELTSKCRKNIVNKDLLDVLTNTIFTSNIPLCNYVNKMTFANMRHGKNTPPRYTMDNCKNSFKGLDVQGDISDWNKLIGALNRLVNTKNNTNNTNQKKEQWGGFENFNSQISTSNAFTDYIKRCIDTVSMIIHCKFKKPEMQQTFFKNVFNCEPESQNVDGWIKNFYVKNVKQNICKYNSHISFIPFKSANVNNMEESFLQAGGMCYSVVSKGTLYPQYGIVKFKIFDNELYKQLRGVETPFFAEKVEEKLNQYVNFKYNQMNPIISHQPQSYTHNKIQQIIQNEQKPHIPPHIPQSILFSLDRTHVTKPIGGEYLKVFDRDPTIPMMGGSLPQI